MDACSQSFEHVPRVHECVHGESAAHGHNEQTDDTEWDHCTDKICGQVDHVYILK